MHYTHIHIHNNPNEPNNQLNPTLNSTQDVHLDVHKGVITDAKIFSDSLFPQLILELQETLKNVPYQPKEIKEKLEQVAQDNPALEEQIRQFYDWLLQEM